MPIFCLLQAVPISPNMWAVIALGAATIIYAVFLRPMMRQKKDPLARPPRSASSLSQQRSVERQMETLLVELSNMARQITAQLDTRAGKLEALIKEADEKIAAIKALASTPAAPGTPSPAAARLSLPAAPERVEDPRHIPVYELSDAGFSPKDIANELNRPSGEIELILALRPRR